MSNGQMTQKEKLIEWKERCNLMCSCGEDTVIYYCNDTKCPHNKTDPLFCVPCISAGDKHEHVKPPLIYDKIMELDKSWSKIKEAFIKLTAASIQSYKVLQPLILYFE